VLEPLVAAARLAQFAAAAVLFGAPLFYVWALDGQAPAFGRRLLQLAATLLAVGGATVLLAQTATITGDAAAAFDPQALGMVITGTAFGMALVARILLAFTLLVAAMTLPAGRRLWTVSILLGSAILASFAWTGHGASEPGAAGAIHAASDIVHLTGAGAWLGALAPLGLMLTRRPDGAGQHLLHRGLAKFAGIGSLAVAALVATGLVNSWFLIRPEGVGRLASSPYGLLLLAKLGAFALMLVLAAANRFRLTPALGRALDAEEDAAPALARLRRSVFVEAALGVAVLTAVAVLGMLAPIAAEL
jgi:putative copper resistance protein D